MPKDIVSSASFIGSDFPVSMLDEHEFVPLLGPLMEGGQVRAGTFGSFRYTGGAYELRVASERVDILCYDQNVIPDALMGAARLVIGKIESSPESDTTVSAVAINCGCTFLSDEIGTDGITFCRNLVDTPFSRKFFEESPSPSSAIVAFFTPSPNETTVYYGIRFEPEGESNGQDVTVIISGHNPVEKADSIKEKLEMLEEVKENVVTMHQRLLDFSPQGE